METEAKSLIDLSKEIAAALGGDWTLESYEDEGSKPWRTRLVSATIGSLFLSNTWGGKGRLYIGGQVDGVAHETTQRVSKGLPSITVNVLRHPAQIAGDITRRLLPEYAEVRSKILAQHDTDTVYKLNFQKMRVQVAEVLNVPLRDTDSEVIRGLGNVDVQVCSPTSIRLSGHMLYLTLEQLRRMKAAVPELFEREK